jgi:3-dehydroquinate synthase
MMQKIIRCRHLGRDLSELLQSLHYSRLFVITDEHTEKLCLPLLLDLSEIQSAAKTSIPAGDENKTVDALTQVWQFLSDNEANRKSLLINLGGGMLTDLGGFAAATFKRGIRFINLPTTLLGAVDAAVGGKTGINFNGLKNEIGAFAPAVAVLIDAHFFRTLDRVQLLSGYAEMLKHALLDSPETLRDVLRFDPDHIDYSQLTDRLFQSVRIKERIVRQDPTEQGIRKALNLGHTFGHAFESLSHETQHSLPHGYAVAFGLVCELYLSLMKLDFDPKSMMEIARFVKQHYGRMTLDCHQYPYLYERMQHDKKNESDAINFTLLRAAGSIEINQTADRKEMEEALDFYREN